MRRLIGLTAFASMALILLSGFYPIEAQGKKKKKIDDDEPKAASTSDQVEMMEQAYALAQLGKDKKWPEALLTAARLLRNVGNLTPGKGDFEVEEKGKDSGKDAEPISLFAPEKESDALLGDAIEMTKNMSKETQAAVAALAQKIKDGTRSPQAGPQMFQNMLKPGQRNAHTVPFIVGQPARVMARSSNGAPLQVTVLHNGSPLAMRTGPVAGLGFVANGNPPRHTIRVINVGPVPTAYQLIIN